MCTGRVDLAFVIRAFQSGADGVIIGGCWPGECHYVTEGNYDALGNMHLGRKLFERVGLNPERLRIEWIAASEGTRFASVMSDFTEQIRELGPVGEVEGIDKPTLKLKLDAVNQLVPYLKLVEREKLRAPERTEDAINAFFDSDAVNTLFDELVLDKLTISQILMLLAQGPLSTREIADKLALSPSEVSKHVGASSSQGLVRYDQDRGSYALA